MQKRSLLAVFILTMVTFGFYSLYWFYITRKEMLARGATNIWPVFVLFIPMIIVSGLGMLLLVMAPFSEGTGQTSTVSNDAAVPLVAGIILAVIASVVIGFMWIHKYAKGVEFVTSGHTTQQYAFWTYVLCNFLGVVVVWMLMMQNAFNKVDDLQTPQPPVSPTPIV